MGVCNPKWVCGSSAAAVALGYNPYRSQSMKRVLAVVVVTVVRLAAR